MTAGHEEHDKDAGQEEHETYEAPPRSATQRELDAQNAKRNFSQHPHQTAEVPLGSGDHPDPPGAGGLPPKHERDTGDWPAGKHVEPVNAPRPGARRPETVRDEALQPARHESRESEDGQPAAGRQGET